MSIELEEYIPFSNWKIDSFEVGCISCPNILDECVSITKGGYKEIDLLMARF